MSTDELYVRAGAQRASTYCSNYSLVLLAFLLLIEQANGGTAVDVKMIFGRTMRIGKATISSLLRYFLFVKCATISDVSLFKPTKIGIRSIKLARID